MTHEYTILTGGTILDVDGHPQATAVAWARDTVLLVGSDEDVRSISRGDSHFIDLHGAFVVPLGDADEPTWPSTATLEIGGMANLTVFDDDPRRAERPARTIAVVRAGRVISGRLGDLGS